MKPSTFMEEWSERDRALAQALMDYEATSFCPGCHQLKSIAYSKASHGTWELAPVAHCYACEAYEEEKDKMEEPEPGELRSLRLNEEDWKRAKLALERRG